MIELFVTFFKLGLFTIGGGVAMIPILSDIIVNDKKWFSEDEMLDMVSVCQSMPGVIAVNMATYVGFKRRGFFGSLVSTIGVVIPSFVIILLIAGGLSSTDRSPYVDGMLSGLKAAALGLIILAVYQLARGVMKDSFSIVGAIAAFTLIAIFKINVVYVILLFLFIGVILTVTGLRRIGSSDNGTGETGGDGK